MAETEVTNQVNAALEMDLSILKTNLVAMMKIKGKGYQILLIPSPTEEPAEVSLKELMEDIKKISGGDEDAVGKVDGALTEAIDDKNKEAGTGIKPEDITFSLKMVYLYIDSTNTDESGKKIIDYAFNISINTSGLIPEAIKSFVDVKHIGVAVWNTKRSKILDKMSIASIEDFLEDNKAMLSTSSGSEK